MKRKTLLAICLLSALCAMGQNRGFKHPGGFHSAADFERVKEQIANNEPTVTKAYNALVTWAKNNKDTGPGATEEIIRGKSNNTGNAAYRVKLAYKYALLWNLTGESKYADIAINILNTWASTCKRVTGTTDAALASGLQGYQFAQVGELMRNYSGWRPDDFKAYQKWMLDVFYTGNTYFLYMRNGVNPVGYWSNWGLCNALSLMSIGILCDDIYIYNMGAGFIKYDMVPQNNQCKHSRHTEWWDYSQEPYRSYPRINEDADGNFRDNGYNEFVGNLVPYLAEDERGVDIHGDGTHWLGQMQELGRDQGHNAMSIGEIADICATAWNQDDDIWGWMGYRIAAGIEGSALYNYDKESTVPFKRLHYRSDNKSNSYSDYSLENISSSSRGQYRPVWYKIVGHYEGVKGIKMEYARKMAESNTAALDEYSGVDHLGFTHLMNIVPPRTDGKRPVYIEPYVVVDGTEKHQSCYDNLPVGQAITLKAVVPDSVSGGSWTWDMGADTVSATSTEGSLTVSPTKSNIYRACYTAPNGTVSTQMFSVGVHGDCYADPIKKYFYVSHPTQTDRNGWKTAPVNRVYAGSTTTLSCQAGTNTGTWRYFVKTDGQEATITTGNAHLDRDTTIYVEYTNMGGGVTLDSVQFVMEKEEIATSYAVNDGDTLTGASLVCSTGDKVVLIPTYSKPKSWLWSTGDTTQCLTIDHAAESGSYTVTVTNTDGNRVSASYNVTILDVAKNQLAEGDYYFIKKGTDLYWTNPKTAGAGIMPTLKAKADNDDKTQVWTLTLDGGHYKLTNKYDGRYINEKANFHTNPYSANWNTYDIYSDKDLNAGFQVTGLAVTGSQWSLGGAYFWGWNGSKVEVVKTHTSLQGTDDLIFTLMPYQSTGISNVTSATPSLADGLYTLTGVKVDTASRPQAGLYIEVTGGKARKVIIK